MCINAIKISRLSAVLILFILAACMKSTGADCLPRVSAVYTLPNAETHIQQKHISKKTPNDDCPAEEYPYHIYNGSDD